MTHVDQYDSDDGVAIVGMSGQFPGARTVRELWANLLAGRDTISRFSPAELEPSSNEEMSHRASPDYVRARGVLEGVDMFDAGFFGILPKEAEVLDPQQRLFLEAAWEALEDAGHDPKSFDGQIGVFAGASNNSYYLQNLLGAIDATKAVGWLTTMMGNEKDYLATRVAYKLDLKGPALNVQTACSTSLVAVCTAVQSLQVYQCDMALAGGVSVTLPQRRGYLCQEGAITSPDGYCRAFDRRAAGTVFSNGLGVVVLRRLQDAIADRNTVYAVIKGAALNNDGSAKLSFTAPSVGGHAQLIAMAQALAGIDPATISYVEAHGTGTNLGDPVEIAGLTQAFRAGGDERIGRCAIGSIKTNIGHLDAAAGAAGLIKTCLALHHKVIPATLHFEEPNPALELEKSPFYVNATTRAWDDLPLPRRACVSSFGVGGTNSHVVVEESPAPAPAELSRGRQLLVLSARSANALESASQRLREHLTCNSSIDLPDVAYTLQLGRRKFEHRRAFVCGDRVEALEALSGKRPKSVVSQSALACNGVAFLFPGQGVQHVNMGRELYEAEPVFRREVDESCEVLTPMLGTDLRSLLYPTPDRVDEAQRDLTQTSFTQPALFVIEHALARLWMSWVGEPAAMIGHSLGEYVAATIALTFERDEALRLLAHRARLMQSIPAGSMLAIKAATERLAPFLSESTSIAAFNTPNLVVVSGEHAAIADLEKTLEGAGIACRRLETSHAFHSSMMEPIMADFYEAVRKTGPKRPRRPWISSLSGAVVSDDEAADPQYWVQQLRQPVRFAEGIGHVVDSGHALLEVGPGRSLATFAKQHPAFRTGRTVVTAMPGNSSATSALDQLLLAVGQLWCSGVEVSWNAFNDGHRRRRISLPTYPFERQRFWIGAHASTNAAGELLETKSPPDPGAVDTSSKEGLSVGVREGLIDSLKQMFSDLSGLEAGLFDPTVPFVELGLDSLVLTQAVGAIHKRFGVKVRFRDLFDSYATIAAVAEGIQPQVDTATLDIPGTAGRPASPHMLSTAGPQLLPPTTTDSIVHTNDAASVNINLVQNLQLIGRQVQLLEELVRGSSTAKPIAGAPLQQTGGAPPIMTAISRPSSPVAATRRDLQSTAQVSAPVEPNATRQGFGPYRPPVRGAGVGLTATQQRNLEAFAEGYCRRTAKSKELTAQHRPHLADPRSVAGFRRTWKEIVYPIVTTRSLGSKLWDIDGNDYVDLVNGFGSIFFGHNPEFIREALKQQLDKGIEIGPQSPLAGDVARLLCEMVGMQRAAFCNTGSEAVSAAIRIARTVTGRDKIAMFEGAYHGIFDEVLVRAPPGSGLLGAVPIAPGIPGSMAENIVVLDYGAPTSLDAIKSLGTELAAVLVEPVQSRRPERRPREFVQELRKITKQSGVALVFDEVVTGFRVHPRGMQEVFGVDADIAAYGKVLGGGLPIGIVAGGAEYLDALDGGQWQFGDSSTPEVGVTFFAGTFVRHPLALASCRAVLTHLKESGPELQRNLNLRTKAFVQRLNQLASEAGAPVRVVDFASWFMIELPHDAPLASLLFAHLRQNGVHLWDGRPGFLTLAHTDVDLDRVAAAFSRSIEQMLAAGFLPQDTAARPPEDGARRGRDAGGRPFWFIPDPARPGKYLQFDSRVDTHA